jgi:hypothetical protein
MNPEQQRIVIAEACGFYDIANGYGWVEFKGGQLLKKLPDYLHDLNAMHEAEKVLSRGEDYNQTGGFGRYKTALAEVCDEQHPIDATAAQRAEAFLRTIGKWEDGK